MENRGFNPGNLHLLPSLLISTVATEAFKMKSVKPREQQLCKMLISIRLGAAKDGGVTLHGKIYLGDD